MAATAFTDDPWTDADVCRLLGNSCPARPIWVDIQERSVGECRAAAEAVLTALHEEGQDTAFTVTEDPKYEWLGTLCRYQPGKGMHCHLAEITDPVTGERTTLRAPTAEQLDTLVDDHVRTRYPDPDNPSPNPPPAA